MNDTDKPVFTYEQYVQLTSDSKTPPRLTLKVQDDDVTFLVDSGAEVSVIQSNVLPNAPKTTKFLKTVGAAGVTKLEPISELLTVCFGDYKGEHPFLLSDVCPVNLMGRDLMCALNIVMHCERNGIKVTSVTVGLYPVGSCESKYYYSWDVVEPSDAEKLLSMVPQISEAPAQLQCVSHLSPNTRDYTYEEQWD